MDDGFTGGSLRLADNLIRYIRRLDEVQGWLSPTTALVLGELLWFQSRNGAAGGVAEIGIHHGKSFIPLALAADPSDRLFAIDCFEDQNANLDASGQGDLAAFRQNFATFAPRREVKVIVSDSAQVAGRLDELELRNLRFLSVDGAHTRKMTLNDLEIADRTLNGHGICVLDDILNGYWTGVVTGLFDFYRTRSSLVPVALVPNKLVLCRPEGAPACRAFLRQAFAPALLKTGCEFADWEIDFYGELPADAWPGGPLQAGHEPTAPRPDVVVMPPPAPRIGPVRRTRRWLRAQGVPI